MSERDGITANDGWEFNNVLYQIFYLISVVIGCVAIIMYFVISQGSSNIFW